MRRPPRSILVPLALGATLTTIASLDAAPAVAARHDRVLVVPAGQTLVLDTTTRLHRLVVEPGAEITAPSGSSVVLTVDGVETGAALETTSGVDTVIAPGTWKGAVVLHVVQSNLVPWQSLTYPERQAVYVDRNGVEPSLSVLDAAQGGTVSDDASRGVSVTSTGQDFTGFYVKDRRYTLRDTRIHETGNGRSDFAGYGAGVVADGSRLVVRHATIANQGAARVGLLAANGANVLVDDSVISVTDGQLPSDYVPTVDLEQMRSAPWMLGINDDARATNITGDNTKATYVNSSISSEGWGVLSTDSGSNAQLTSIGSHVFNTGDEGYGAYAIGNATDRFLGSRLDVGTYGAIVTGGSGVYGDSTRSAVKRLDDQLGLGLGRAVRDSIANRATVVNSRGWGVMWHGQGTATVTGRTKIRSQRATFLDKGQQVAIDVDGSQGAQLDPADGVLMQVMTNDDPGPVVVDGKLVNEGVYHEPTDPPTKDPSFDVTTAHDTDAVATFTDTSLAGDFYNGYRGGPSTGPTGPGPAPATGRNLVVNLADTDLTGVVSSSTTHHAVDTITAADYKQLGVVTNAVGQAVNNGALVALTGGSTWTVTGTSYLSSLSVGSGSAVTAPAGHTLTMTVDGTPTTIVPGQAYTGNVVLSIS